MTGLEFTRQLAAAMTGASKIQMGPLPPILDYKRPSYGGLFAVTWPDEPGESVEDDEHVGRE